MTETFAEQAQRHLLRADGQEDVCLATYTFSTGHRRTSILLNSLVLPAAGDRTVHGNAAFSSSYLLRGAAEAAEAGHGLVMLHSHPLGSGWQLLSRTDRDSEHGVARIAEEYTGRPLAGMTLAGDGTWSARV